MRIRVGRIISYLSLLFNLPFQVCLKGGGKLIQTDKKSNLKIKQKEKIYAGMLELGEQNIIMIETGNAICNRTEKTGSWISYGEMFKHSKALR